MKKIVFILIALIINLNCAKKIATINIVDDKTLLEKQILGQFESFNKQVYLMASVRSIDSNGKLKKSESIPESKKKVISAMQRISFNYDDIKFLKKNHVLGENNRGYLTFFKKNFNESVGFSLEFIKKILEEENADRKILMQRILETNVSLENNEISKIEKIYAAMKRDISDAGELIQLPDNSWTSK